MANMVQTQKVKAQLHIIVGPQHISVPFESDVAAEREFQITISMLEKREEGSYRIITHENGAVWIDLNAVDGMTWTREQRVPVQGGYGGFGAPPLLHG